jgi:prolyl oligopeptidase
MHGTEVADPYRWLEDAASDQTRDWVAAQNRHSAPYLASLPARSFFQQRLTALWQQPRHGLPQRVGGVLFYEFSDGQQNQPVLMALGAGGKQRVVFDPNALSADGLVSLAQWQVSPDGRWLAYALSQAGSDWQTIEVMRLADGQRASGPLSRVKFSGLAWLPDSSGLYYARYPDPPDDQAGAETFDPLANQALYVHRLGRPQAEDRLVFAQPAHPDRGFDGEVTEDGRYLVVSVWRGAASENAVVVKPLDDDSAPWDAGNAIELVPDFAAQYSLIGNEGSTLYFMTTAEAPRGRVVKIDMNNPDAGWQAVIPQGRDTLQSAVRAGPYLVTRVMRDATHALQRYALDGVPKGELSPPGLGAVSALRGEAGRPELDVIYTAFNQPAVLLSADVTRRNDRLEPLFPSELPFDPDMFVTEQVFVTSRDGTRVPMFISHRKGLDRSAPKPVHLYGYGGFNVALTPHFSAANLAWMEAGGVYAVANLRGGGEYGRDWHRAGTGANKQNVFDDFIAAAGYLIDREWTTAKQLAISGHSNGGLLVGAVLNQQPRLFGAAVAGVGVMDMLRFHRFTIGRAWTGDYGSPEDPEDFKHLLAYSPLRNLKPGTRYPPVLVTTADHDDRVVPAHSYKYAAALQWAQGGPAPVMIRIETDAGHGAGKPLSKRIDEAADQMAFLAHHVGLDAGVAVRLD